MGQLPANLRNLDAVDWLTSAEREAILRFERGIRAIPGLRLNRLILFGSRARGEGNAESDLDLAVVLSDDEGPYWRQIVDVASEMNLEWEYRIRVSPLILSHDKLADLWQRERSIAHAILVEGIEV
jgi:predicted nucleotidyltransferase